MRYLSVFAGIEAASVAWHRLGWEPVGFSEIDPFASSVLAHRFPHVRNYGDITKHSEWDLGPGSVDLLVGGSPCQAFSVAGLRRGLDDPRGQLTLVYLQLAARLEPEWIVWENVPGVLSADGGRAFGAFLGGLAELGYGFAYRVLDARYFGVPQRRRRVFLVARRAGDWRSCAEILLEPASMPGHPPSRIPSRKDLAADPATGARAGRWWDGSDCAATLTKQNAGGSQRMPDKGNFACVLDHVGTLDRSCGGDKLQVQAAESGHFIPFACSGHGSYTPGIGNLRSSGGDLAGAETVLVGALCAGDWRRTGNTMVEQGKIIAVDVYNGVIDGDTAATVTSATGIANASGPKVAEPHAFYSTGGSHGLEANAGVSPPIKCGSALSIGIPSPPAVAYRKSKRARSDQDDESWVEADHANCLNQFDTGERDTHAVAYTIDMQACKGNANIGDGSVSPTLCKPSGNDVHAIAFKTGNSAKARGNGESTEVTPTLGSDAGGNTVPAVVYPIQDGRDLNKAQNGLGIGDQNTPSYTIDTTGAQSVAVRHATESQGSRIRDVTEPSETLRATKRGPFSDFYMTPSMVVRRLTPTECERLQGFPDGWTLVPHRGKAAADGPRYKALGNSMAVPCMAWIGERIQAIMDSER